MKVPISWLKEYVDINLPIEELAHRLTLAGLEVEEIRYVVLPIIAPSLIGVALFGFTLSYDEFARTLLTAGSYNTLPLEIFGMTTNVTTPVIYALGTLTTLFSFAIIAAFLLGVWIMGKRRARLGSDAGKGV